MLYACIFSEHPSRPCVAGTHGERSQCKINSFNDVLNRLKPHIWMVEETKLKPNETIKCGAAGDFQVFYLSRQNSQGGGLALGVSKMFESTFINEGDDDTEIMSVLVVVGDIPIRVIVGYAKIYFEANVH